MHQILFMSQRLLRLLALGDVDPGRDHVSDGAPVVGETRVLPADEPQFTRARQPVVLVRVGEGPRLQIGHRSPHVLGFRRRDHHVPERAPDDLRGAVPAQALAGAVEAHQPTLRVEDHNERFGAAQNRFDEPLLVGQLLLRLDGGGDVAGDRDAAEEPAVCHDRLHHRLEPDLAAVANPNSAPSAPRPPGLQRDQELALVAGLRHPARQQLVEWAAHRLGGRVAEQALGRVGPVCDPIGRIGRKHGVGDVAEAEAQFVGASKRSVDRRRLCQRAVGPVCPSRSCSPFPIAGHSFVHAAAR